MQYSNRRSVLLDLNKRRIRIYRSVLHLLGDPTHIAIIVTPHESLVKIQQSEKYDPKSYSIERIINNRDRTLEIYCQPFLQSLYEMNECWDRNQAYRVYGDISSDGIEVTFKFSDSVQYGKESGCKVDV